MCAIQNRWVILLIPNESAADRGNCTAQQALYADASAYVDVLASELRYLNKASQVYMTSLYKFSQFVVEAVCR